MLKFLRKLWLDQRGEEGDAGAAAPAGAGTGNANAIVLDNGSGDAGQAGDGSAAAAEVTPRFGEFGDNPEEAATKLLEVYQRTQSEYGNFKTKAGLTERNLGSIRKALEGSGIRAVETEDGQIRLEALQKETRKSRFTDEHKGLFEPKVLESMRLLVQDIFDEQYDGREKMTKEEHSKMQQFIAEKTQVENDLEEDYPMINPKFKDGKPTNPNFNKALYDRATEIWETEYNKNPLKQYSATRKAARELSVFPGMIQAAKKEGVEIGKANKRILAPVGGAGAPAGGSGGFRKLSQAEYFALPSEKRAEYDQKSVNQ